MLFTRFDPFLQCADRNTYRSTNTDGWQLSGCNQLIDFCTSYSKRLCCLRYAARGAAVVHLLEGVPLMSPFLVWILFNTLTKFRQYALVIQPGKE